MVGINPGSWSYSAILVTHNAELTIERALRSILAQNVPPTEIIMVDDCSSDSTVKLAETILSNYSRRQILVNSRNLGQSYSRNYGASLANFDTLIFFDDDDVSMPGRSRLHIGKLQESEVSYVSSTKFYSSKYKLNCINANYALCSIELSHFISYLLLGKNNFNKNLYVPSSTLACKRSVIPLIGGFDLAFRRLEDVDFAIRAAIAGLKISWTSEIGVQRFHTVNDTKGQGIDSSFELLLIAKFETLLTPTEVREAEYLSKVRRFYFSADMIGLLKLIILHPHYWWFSFIRIPSLIRRKSHEARM
jgi:glycosyltransferase involved in cell wall biosynthesis